jgi:dihydroorotate dehydrogenase
MGLHEVLWFGDQRSVWRPLPSVKSSFVRAALRGPERRDVLLSLRADQPGGEELARIAIECGAVGVWVRGEVIVQDGVASGQCAREAVLDRVRARRASLPERAVLIGGGVLAPADVVRLREAGAPLASTEVGLVFAGPGLIKRCNQALLLCDDAAQPAPEALSLRAARAAWFWSLMLGMAMFAGGILALLIASTRVVLPYDETLCGLTRAQLAGINPRLLPFMSHDRVTLAGTMLSVGVLYMALAWNGVRHGEHWALVTLLCSAFAGFANLFAFLAFGYFDPFHAFVSAILFRFLLLSMVSPLGAGRPIGTPEWQEDRSWRRGQWGQLLFVVMGVGLIAAGGVITYVGCTQVFVREDLAFMRTSIASLASYEGLFPLVAHDRVTLGGMLLANGIAVTLTTLWGFRRRAAWLWYALAWADALAFTAAVGVHFVVGYDSLVHLAPAFLGGATWAAALGLTRGWLTAADIGPQRR